MQPENFQDDYKRAVDAQLSQEEKEYRREIRRKANNKLWTSMLRWLAGMFLFCIFLYEFLAFTNHLSAGTTINDPTTWFIILFGIFCAVSIGLAGNFAD